MDNDMHMFTMFFAGFILFGIGVLAVMQGEDVKSKAWKYLGYLLMAVPVTRLIFFFLFD